MTSRFLRARAQERERDLRKLPIYFLTRRCVFRPRVCGRGRAGSGQSALIKQHDTRL